MKWVQRLVSPAGFALALLFFLFPFAAVSCEQPGVGTFEASYTGVDLATGGDPTVKTSDEFADVEPVADRETPPDPDVALLAILTVVVIAAGLGVSLLPSARARLRGAGAAALGGGVLLVITQVRALANLRADVRDEVVGAQQELSTEGISAEETQRVLDDIVQTRIGFWLVVVTLGLVVLFNVGVAVHDRSRQ